MSQSNILIEQFFSGLAGSWQVERIIDGQSRVLGTADFKSNCVNELHYLEQGIMTLSSGKQLPARQSYIYRLDAGSIYVFFDAEPRRLFHRVDLEICTGELTLRGHGQHKCNNDLYTVEYRFYRNNVFKNFEIEYHIDGPAKHSIIICRYQDASMLLNQRV